MKTQTIRLNYWLFTIFVISLLALFSCNKEEDIKPAVQQSTNDTTKTKDTISFIGTWENTSKTSALSNHITIGKSTITSVFKNNTTTFNCIIVTDSITVDKQLYSEDSSTKQTLSLSGSIKDSILTLYPILTTLYKKTSKTSIDNPIIKYTKIINY